MTPSRTSGIFPILLAHIVQDEMTATNLKIVLTRKNQFEKTEDGRVVQKAFTHVVRITQYFRTPHFIN